MYFTQKKRAFNLLVGNANNKQRNRLFRTSSSSWIRKSLDTIGFPPSPSRFRDVRELEEDRWNARTTKCATRWHVSSRVVEYGQSPIYSRPVHVSKWATLWIILTLRGSRLRRSRTGPHGFAAVSLYSVMHRSSTGKWHSSIVYYRNTSPNPCRILDTRLNSVAPAHVSSENTVLVITPLRIFTWDISQGGENINMKYTKDHDYYDVCYWLECLTFNVNSSSNL